MHYLEVLLVFGIVCQVSCLRNFQRIGSKYYHIEGTDKLDWFEAYDKCKSMDAHMISIQNKEEWTAITDHLKAPKSYWLDIRNINASYNFTSSTTGQAAPYLNWYYGYPKNNCVRMRAYFNYMKTKNCSMKNHYICESNSSLEEKSTYKYDILDLKVMK